jgi:hypothetical protein
LKITNKAFLIIFALLLTTLGASHGFSQQVSEVKILRIDIDGRSVKSDFKLYVNKDGRRLEPVRSGRSFRVPAGLGCEPVSVEVLVKGLHLLFEPIYPSKFTTNWIIGVDKQPFEGETLGTDNSRDVKLIYYIQFVSAQGDDTRLVITEKKKQASPPA